FLPSSSRLALLALLVLHVTLVPGPPNQLRIPFKLCSPFSCWFWALCWLYLHAGAFGAFSALQDSRVDPVLHQAVKNVYLDSLLLSASVCCFVLTAACLFSASTQIH
ncbi:hypothetical protein FB451DRAFT_678942, partial [Mycena latifolia]